MDRQITITMSRSHWTDLMIDLDAWGSELSDGIYDECNDLEPGSVALIELLRQKGVE